MTRLVGDFNHTDTPTYRRHAGQTHLTDCLQPPKNITPWITIIIHHHYSLQEAIELQRALEWMGFKVFQQQIDRFSKDGVDWK